MLGHDVAAAVRVVNHNALDDTSLQWCGHMAGDVPVWLNRAWLEADVRITTGFVEPHFFAGFSGGPKLAAPGLAGLETVLALHDARRIGHPSATWGITEGNPVHDAVRAIAERTGVHFTLDVLLDRQHHIVRTFAGDLLVSHAASTARSAKAVAMEPVGPPLRCRGHLELGLSTRPEPVPGGEGHGRRGRGGDATVVRSSAPPSTVTASPTTGRTGRCWRRPASPAALLRSIESSVTTTPDQWQAQIQARIQSRARVLVH